MGEIVIWKCLPGARCSWQIIGCNFWTEARMVPSACVSCPDVAVFLSLWIQLSSHLTTIVQGLSCALCRGKERHLSPFGTVSSWKRRDVVVGKYDLGLKPPPSPAPPLGNKTDPEPLSPFPHPPTHCWVRWGWDFSSSWTDFKSKISGALWGKLCAT